MTMSRPISDLPLATFADRLSRALCADPARLVAESRRDDDLLRWSVAQTSDTVFSIGRGMSSLGLAAGDCGAILAATDAEWLFADLAMIRLGMTSVGIYPTESAAKVEYVLRDCNASIVFVDSAEQLAKVDAVRSRLPALRYIVALKPVSAPDTEASGGAFQPMTLKTLCAADGAWNFPRAIAPESPAILIYTSGTTGAPKGAVITQANLLAMVDTALAAYDFTPGWVRPSYLPLCHVAERLFTLCGLVGGMTTRFVPDLAALPETLREIRPQHMLGVPRIYEKILEASAEARQPGASPAVAMGLQRAELLLCGGARLPAALVAKYAAAGLPIYDIYGMTEAGVVTTNRPGDSRTGSLGRSVAGIETKLLPDGELLIRGDGVFSGYLNKPDQTAAALKDGWFHTGDIVTRDADGYFHIVDRKNDILNTSGAKLVAPAPIEEKIGASPLVAGSIVIGNDRKYLTALILLDEAGCRRFALNEGLPFESLDAFGRHASLIAAIDGLVSTVNRHLSRVEQIKRYHLVSQTFAPTDPEMTPTMKVRRRVFEERYADAISAMYDQKAAAS